MGCCNSKPKEKKPTGAPSKASSPKVETREDKAKAQGRQPVEAPPAPAEKETPKAEVEPDEPALSPEDARKHRLETIRETRKHPFKYDRCLIDDGDVHPLFEEGVVYRIEKDGDWYIYNDSLEYEAHVDYLFGPTSDVVAGERTSLETKEDGWICAHAIAYPLETVKYVSGTFHGYKSSVTTEPVSKEYLSEMSKDSKETVQRELAAVKNLADGSRDEEVILQRCVESHTPYVDVNFVPTAHMLSRQGHDARELPDVSMQRPTQYLPDDQKDDVNAIRGPVVPQSVEPGRLGNCWVTCAAGVMAESEGVIQTIFANNREEERAVGAYRVELSKHGWWRSVIVDDYIPTVNGVPFFAHIYDDPREMWVSLLEKAYAKVHGSYATITGGDSLQVLADFTGMPTYRFDKEWESASMNSEKIAAFVKKITRYHENGYAVMLSTPGFTSTSYLGCKRDSNPDAFRAKYLNAGLRCGHTYYVEKIVTSGQYTLFKIRNPWNSKSKWTGAWSAGSEEWDHNPLVRRACDLGEHSEDDDSSFWMNWDDAINYFDGGGLVYWSEKTTDYRVRGEFAGTIPSVALEITVKEPTKVFLMLSQHDKRGFTDHEDGQRFAPCMLSIAQHDGRRYVVEANSSWDPEVPSTEYNFMVARDVAASYTFQPRDEPYLVVPRIHRLGVAKGYNRPFVIGVAGQEPLDGKLDIRCVHIPDSSRVFKNLITFDGTNLPSVEAECQVHRVGELPKSEKSEMLLGVAPSPRPAATHDDGTSEVEFMSEIGESTAHRRSMKGAETEEVAVTVTDTAGTPIDFVAESERKSREAAEAESAQAKSLRDDSPEL